MTSHLSRQVDASKSSAGFNVKYCLFILFHSEHFVCSSLLFVRDFYVCVSTEVNNKDSHFNSNPVYACMCGVVDRWETLLLWRAGVLGLTHCPYKKKNSGEYLCVWILLCSYSVYLKCLQYRNNKKKNKICMLTRERVGSSPREQGKDILSTSDKMNKIYL